MTAVRIESSDETGAALVCQHIAGGSEPIRLAFRIEPVEAADSGWQFFCGVFTDEDPGAARVWSLGDVLELDPGLAEYLSSPPGTELSLDSGGWRSREGASE